MMLSVCRDVGKVQERVVKLRPGDAFHFLRQRKCSFQILKGVALKSASIRSGHQEHLLKVVVDGVTVVVGDLLVEVGRSEAKKWFVQSFKNACLCALIDMYVIGIHF